MNTSSKKRDLLTVILVFLLVISLVFIFGDALYIGTWYYFVVFLIAICLASFLKPMPFFQAGVAVGITITFLAYLCINWFSSRPEGMLGLGHLFSLPGAAVGLIVSAIFLKKTSKQTFLISFLFGMAGVLIGFLMNQLLVCNTLISCSFFLIEY